MYQNNTNQGQNNPNFSSGQINGNFQPLNYSMFNQNQFVQQNDFQSTQFYGQNTFQNSQFQNFSTQTQQFNQQQQFISQQINQQLFIPMNQPLHNQSMYQQQFIPQDLNQQQFFTQQQFNPQQMNQFNNQSQQFNTQHFNTQQMNQQSQMNQQFIINESFQMKNIPTNSEFGKISQSFYGTTENPLEQTSFRHLSISETNEDHINIEPFVIGNKITESFLNNEGMSVRNHNETYLHIYKVKVNHANNLIAADMNGKSDPFCVLRLNSLQIFKTSVKKCTLNPVWKEEFLFRMLNPKTDRLRVDVYDWDRLKSNDPLGYFDIRMADLESLQYGQSVTSNYSLKDVKSGTVNLTISAEGMKDQQEKYDKKKYYVIVVIDDAKLKESSKLKSFFTKKKPKSIHISMENEIDHTAYFHDERIFLHVDKISTLYFSIQGVESNDVEFKFDLTKLDLSEAQKLDLNLPSCGSISIIIKVIPNHILNITDKLSFGETKYVNERLKKVKVALAKLLNVDVSQIKRIPRISLACSGGGMRSMTATLGYYQALQDFGLLDCICYISTLSGSTWNIFQWFHQTKKVEDFSKLQTYEIKKIDINDPVFLNVTSHLKKQFQDGISNGIVYLYGVMLAHSLFKGHIPKGVYLNTSDLIFSPQYVNHDVPYPIFSGICVKKGVTCQQWNKWYEFTPHWSGFQEYQGYIDTYLFGCNIENGELLNPNPNESAAHILAIASSAFTETFEYNMKFMVKSKEKKDAVSVYLDQILGNFKNTRIALSHVNNYMKGMKDNAFENETELCFADAGLIEGMPALPLLRKERKVDFMIMLDSSSPTKLYSTYDHIKNQKLNSNDIRDLPPGFDTEKLKEINEKYQHYILNGVGDEPTCLYMPLKNNPKYKFHCEKIHKLSETGGFPNFGTFKLSYTKEEAHELFSLCEFNLKEALPSFIDEIRKFSLE